MFKIIIDGEGSREKREFNNFKDANYEVMMRRNQTIGYDKTWITIIKDNKEILKSRLDLTVKDRCKTLKELLIKDIENDIWYCKECLKKGNDIEKFKGYIEECEKVKTILEFMDNEGNYKIMYNYSFYFKGDKVWEYTLDEIQEDKYTETTIKILCGEVQGYGKPIEGARKEDIKVIVKEITLK